MCESWSNCARKQKLLCETCNRCLLSSIVSCSPSDSMMRPRAAAPGTAAPKPSLVQAASRGDIGALAQAASRGAAAAASSSGASSSAMRLLEADNVQLRRELAEVRQQLLPLLAADAPQSAEAISKATPPLPASFWLEAQLQQSRRHVQLLTEALMNRAELSTELEVILLQLREQKAPACTSAAAAGGVGTGTGAGAGAQGAGAGAGTPGVARGLTPEWAAAAMRRIRSVQFAESLADELRAQQQRRRSTGPGRRVSTGGTPKTAAAAMTSDAASSSGGGAARIAAATTPE